MAEDEIKQKIDGMGATLTDVPEPTCTPCLSENTEVIAKCYCVQCKEYLCYECRFHHQKVTVSKSHTLVGTEHATLPDVFEVNEEGLLAKMGSRGCHIHPGQAVEQFCTAHKVLCCSICLEDDHNSCESEPISTVSKGYAKSEELSELTSKLIGLKTSINDIVRRKHNKAIYDVERFLIGSKARLKTVAERILSSHIDTAASTVKERIIECINTSEDMLQNILKDIRHIQVFLDSKTDDEEELFIHAYHENSNLRRLEDFIKSCSEKLPAPWVLSFSPDYKTILSKYVSLKPTTTTTLRVKQPMESNCSITDIECFSDGRYVLVDSSNNALKLFRRNNEYQSTHCLQMRPLNVVEVEPGKLVVTIPEEKIIRFVSVTDTFYDDNTVQVDDTPTGLATFGGKIFVSFMTHLRILGRDGITIERISKGRNGEDLFVNLTCLIINDKTGRFYAVDEGYLAFIHVDSIRQMETRNSSAVLLSQDGKFKPSMTFDEYNSLYVSIPEGIKHFNPDLVELQTFVYRDFYTPIRLKDLPSANKSETAAVSTTVSSSGTGVGFDFGSTGKTALIGKHAGTMFEFSSNTGFGFALNAPVPATTGLKCASFGNISDSSRSNQGTTIGFGFGTGSECGLSAPAPAVTSTDFKGFNFGKTSDSSRDKQATTLGFGLSTGSECGFSAPAPAVTSTDYNCFTFGNISDFSRAKQDIFDSGTGSGFGLSAPAPSVTSTDFKGFTFGKTYDASRDKQATTLGFGLGTGSGFGLSAPAPVVTSTDFKSFSFGNTSDSSRAVQARSGLGTGSGFRLGAPAFSITKTDFKGASFGNTFYSSGDKQATPKQHVVAFPKYAIGCHKSVGKLLIGGESDELSIVHIG